MGVCLDVAVGCSPVRMKEGLLGCVLLLLGGLFCWWSAGRDVSRW